MACQKQTHYSTVGTIHGCSLLPKPPRGHLTTLHIRGWHISNRASSDSPWGLRTTWGPKGLYHDSDGWHQAKEQPRTQHTLPPASLLKLQQLRPSNPGGRMLALLAATMESHTHGLSVSHGCYQQWWYDTAMFFHLHSCSQKCHSQFLWIYARLIQKKTIGQLSPPTYIACLVTASTLEQSNWS